MRVQQPYSERSLIKPANYKPLFISVITMSLFLTDFNAFNDIRVGMPISNYKKKLASRTHNYKSKITVRKSVLHLWRFVIHLVP